MGLLQQAGLATLYARDIAGLNPLLDAMSQRGMPVEAEGRAAVSRQLSEARHIVWTDMQALVPPEARRMKIYKRLRPGCDERPTTANVWVCGGCGQERVTKTHPCVKNGAARVQQRRAVTEWVQPLPFTPSNDQMKRYAKFKGYKLPVRDGRETANETALRRLALRHETDALFPLILRYRELDKLLGTYVGRLEV